MKRILVIEDSKAAQKALCYDMLGCDVELIPAHTLEEAEQLLAESCGFALIVLDACMPGSELDTLPLLKKIRDSFDGPVLASSSNPQHNKALVEGGCSDFADGKPDVSVKIKKMLGL